MSELSQEDGRLFTVPMIVAGLGSTALFAVASFLAKPRGHNLFRWHAGEIMEDLDPIEWARFPVPLPVPASQEENHGHQANHQPQSLGELLEQHLLAINGLRSAISTLRAAAPNARDYQTRTARCVRIGHERASRPARAARKRDGRTRATRRIYFGSVLRRDRCGRDCCSIAFSRFLRARSMALTSLGEILPVVMSVSILH